MAVNRPRRGPCGLPVLTWRFGVMTRSRYMEIVRQQVVDSYGNTDFIRRRWLNVPGVNTDIYQLAGGAYLTRQADGTLVDEGGVVYSFVEPVSA